MKLLSTIGIVLCFVSLLTLIGCSSSKQTQDDSKTPPPPTEAKPLSEIPAQVPAAPEKKIDTLKVDVKDTQKPAYEEKEIPPPSPSPMPTGNFSVQIGAYKMPDNADRIASLAKERFNMKVYTLVDRADNLYKVMIGDFNTKDEARNFRDEMATKFPGDYKDAWVSENPKK
jgi:cell division protein FtsN